VLAIAGFSSVAARVCASSITLRERSSSPATSVGASGLDAAAVVGPG
jgi:hypothetical protein